MLRSLHLRVLFILAVVFVLAGCGPATGTPTPEAGTPDTGTPAAPQTTAPTGTAAAVATPAVTATPAATATAEAAAAPGDVATPAAVSITSESLVAVPVLTDELAPGWDVKNSWSTQFEPSQEPGHAGFPAFLTVFHGESSGLVLEVKPDSPVRYLRANFVGARVWVNSGELDLPTSNLKIGVLTSDVRPYWDMIERPVSAEKPSNDETPLPASDGLLPADQWTEVLIPFDELPVPPTGRYLTGLYLRADGIAGHRLLLAGLELLALPDETKPVPLLAAAEDLTRLRITFNKDVDGVSAEQLANYLVSSTEDAAYRSGQAPVAAVYEPQTMSAILTLPQPMQPGAQYQAEVRGITDLAPQPNLQAAPATLPFTAGVVQVKVDLTRPLHPISPYIYGIAGNTRQYMEALRPTVTNWGGNPASRYNWELGNAFNAGSDWEYRNTDYDNPPGSVSDKFIRDARAVGADVRITLPTLGWVAKNTDRETCSFKDRRGKCYNPGATCQKPGPTADPNVANAPVDVNWVVRWVKHMLERQDFDVRFFALDNEPDLWGFTHYDVHPECTTYQEILDKYLTYATAVRAVAPQAELLGPVSCCWFFYWNSPAGEADKAQHDNKDFLPWFLEQVRLHDEKNNVRTLDALDIHYYPENVYNDKDDPETSAARLEATRSLWDSAYVDPSWIAQPVNLIPRMKQLIAENYPGTKLFISEWNFGGDQSMSGALAIADVLGIFGQEDLYAATYYQSPEMQSPGFFGFKMYTNYDSKGSRFGDIALPAASSNRGELAAYAARDSETGKTTVMLINKVPDRALQVTLQLAGLDSARAEVFRYGQDKQGAIVQDKADLTATSTLALPPYSITLLVVPPANGAGQGK